MKINEPLYPSFDQEAIEQARHGEAELIARMKSEFEDFVAQTRERLRLVSEALSELDRDFNQAPIESSVGSEVAETGPIINSTPAIEKQQQDPSEPVGPSLAEIRDEDYESPQIDADLNADLNAEANADADDVDVWPENVWQSSNPSDGKESASKDASFPESPTASTQTGANGRAQRHQDREIPEAPRSSDEDETDPFERLNAIKERLARQIEKS